MKGDPMAVARACRSLFLLAAVILVAATALAQPFGRTFVSAQKGADVNNCGPTDPCRSFSRAMTNTAANGELIILDSGGYGPFTITTAVQVQAPSGVYAGVTASTGIAVTVNAPGAFVRLKGLSINSTGADFGVKVLAASSVYLDDVTVTGFGNTGDSKTGGVIIASASKLYISGCVFRRNESAVYMNTTPTTIHVLVDRTVFEDTTYAGLWVDPDAEVTVIDSIFDGGSYGVATDKTTVSATVEHCVLTHFSRGLYAVGSSKIRLSNSTITNNDTGVASPAGNILSRGNNTIEANFIDVDGTGGTIGSYTAK
jgi:nitrous oxidase accessory protein NosD